MKTLRIFSARAILLVTIAGSLSASVIYNFRNTRDFPTGPNFDDKNGTLTSTTADSLFTTFSTNPGSLTDNHFVGLDTANGSPFLLGVKNSLTIGQATSSTPIEILSAAAAGITETGVSVTGGSGTGYLLPTFRVRGSFNNGNSSVISSLDICAGNAACTLTQLAFSVGGLQNVDTLYTPAIDLTTTSFQFGTPFTFFFSFAAFMDRQNGVPATPGGPVIADFTNGLQLVSMRVVDANGQSIPGAQIHSQFLDIANAPEPGTAGAGVVMMFLLVVATLRRRPRF